MTAVELDDASDNKYRFSVSFLFFPHDSNFALCVCLLLRAAIFGFHCVASFSHWEPVQQPSTLRLLLAHVLVRLRARLLLFPAQRILRDDLMANFIGDSRTSRYSALTKALLVDSGCAACDANQSVGQEALALTRRCAQLVHGVQHGAGRNGLGQRQGLRVSHQQMHRWRARDARRDGRR